MPEAHVPPRGHGCNDPRARADPTPFDPCLVHGEELRDARDLHLLALQEACDRADFGELFEGRT